MIIPSINSEYPMKTTASHRYLDQKPGTSGLRKRVSVFQQADYLETYIQSIFDCNPDFIGGKICLGGDGRFYNDVAINTIVGMAAANGVSEVILGRDGILSTPACSHIIRKRKLDGGFVLSASHNPGGPDGDFGIKLNLANGGPAPAHVTDKIHQQSCELEHYKKRAVSFDFTQIGTQKIGGFTLRIIDPVVDYADLMENCFDFSAIRDLLSGEFEMSFDALHAVTGPYAVEIFCNRLGVDKAAVRNAVPLPDFGGGHPDPNPVHAKTLFDIMFGPDAPQFGAASDGDGDRYIALGPKQYVSPSDSLAIIAANAHLAPGYKAGIRGIARSMPTSRAADKVAEKLGIPCFETPTGWKYFGNLLEAGKITICGEESAGTSSDHIREKDGLWAILMWLNILAIREQSLAEIVSDHWRTYGRHYYTRHDYEAVDAESAKAVMESLRGQLATLPGQSILGETITQADSFSYTDPVDGSTADNQGLRVYFESGSRIVFRLSGTGTVGATVRLYVERYEGRDGDHGYDLAEATENLAEIANQLTDLKVTLGRNAPSVIS